MLDLLHFHKRSSGLQQFDDSLTSTLENLPSHQFLCSFFADGMSNTRRDFPGTST